MIMARDTFPRSLHDVGLAAWFGGTLANAIALNAAAGEAKDPFSRGAVLNAGWDRWSPVNAGAIGLHLVGGLGLVRGNVGRLQGQQGVATMTAVKTGLTLAALGATAYSRVLGKRVSARPDMPVESGSEPTELTPPEASSAQRQLAVLQWVVPVLTGAVLVVNAFAGEQQRASEVQKGLAARLLGTGRRNRG
jgi:hypothetical protein